MNKKKRLEKPFALLSKQIEGGTALQSHFRSANYTAFIRRRNNFE